MLGLGCSLVWDNPNVLGATQPSFQKIIYTGDLAPNVSDGAIFQTILAPPVINNHGELVVLGTLRHNTGGITSANEHVLWHVAQNRTMTRLLQKGDQVHGAAQGTLYDAFLLPNINDQGRIIFAGFLQAGTGNPPVTSKTDVGWWMTGPGMPIQKVFRNGDPALATAVGNLWNDFFNPSTAFGPSGNFVFQAVMQSNFGDTSSSLYNHAGFWSYASEGGHQLLYRANTHEVPGTSGAKLYALGPIGGLNAQGRFLFNSVLMPGTGDVASGNSRALLLGSIDPNVPMQLIARQGTTPVPGAPAGALFEVLPASDIYFNLNANNQVVFRATLRQGVAGVTSFNNQGIYYTDTSGSLNKLVRSHEIVPGSNLVFNGFNNVIINDQGRIAFEGTTSSLPNSVGVWVTDATYQLKTVALKGLTPIPFTSSSASLSNLRPMAMNAMGHLLVIGDFSDSVNQITMGNVLWCYDPATEELIHIVQSGQMFDVGDGTQRKVTDVVIDNDFLFQVKSGGGDGRAITINDQGQIAFSLTFDNGDVGVYVAQIPEPATLLLTMLSGLTLMRRRHAMNRLA